MISRRDKLLNYPFEAQRYEQHRQKVRSAKPAVDVRCPRSYPHVIIKPKKVQAELERKRRIEAENVRLLQKLGDIMQTKRLQNLWLQPRPNFLHREKLFETRTHSALPKLISIYGPTSNEQLSKSGTSMLKSPLSKTAQRCPTCSGHPTRTEVQIPEQRVPWQPTRKSWSVRSKELTVPKRCLHCGQRSVT